MSALRRHSPPPAGLPRVRAIVSRCELAGPRGQQQQLELAGGEHQRRVASARGGATRIEPQRPELHRGDGLRHRRPTGPPISIRRCSLAAIRRGDAGLTMTSVAPT
jgi:hypothetical protein